jgi:hypothetical protein
MKPNFLNRFMKKLTRDRVVIAFFSIRRSWQSVIAAADPIRRAWPASEPSPKKFPSLNIPIVASLPVLDTDFTFLDIEDSIRLIPLSEDRLLFRDGQHLSGVADHREESVGVELAVLPNGCSRAHRQ